MLRIKKKPFKPQLPSKPEKIYPTKRAGDYPVTSLTNVAWFYQTSGYVVAIKLKDFIEYIEADCQLDGRSFYILVDIYRMALYSKFVMARTLLKQEGFDRLVDHLVDNINKLKDEKLIPDYISDSDLDERICDFDSFTDYDHDMVEFLLILLKRSKDYGNKKEVGIRAKKVRVRG